MCSHSNLSHFARGGQAALRTAEMMLAMKFSETVDKVSVIAHNATTSVANPQSSAIRMELW